MSKKIFFSVLAVVLLIGLTGCPDLTDSTEVDPEVTTYDVTITPSGAATGESVRVSVSTPTTGTTVTLTATLNSGRQVTLSTSGVSFSSSVINSNGGTATFTMPAAAVTVTATFSDTYGVTVSLSGATGGESVTAGVTEAAEGDTVTLTANLPNSNRKVALNSSGVTISPSVISSNGGTATFTMPAEDVTVTVNFVTVASHTATSVNFNMHYVPSGGSFTMGENFSSITQEVTLTKNYWMGETEVTQGLWEDVWGTTWPEIDPEGSGYGAGSDYPAYYVNWYDTVAFCNLLTQVDASITNTEQVYYSDSGLTTAYTKYNAASEAAVYVDWDKTGYRLPTEAEWEYSARYVDGTTWNGGDHVSGGPVYTDETDPDKIGDYAWYLGNNSGSSGEPSYGTKEVGQKTANALGLRDMSGNVYEWCYDRKDDYSGVTETNPSGPGSGSYRVYRGGYWGGYGYNLRCAHRYGYYPTLRSDNGLRLCRTAD